MADGSGAETAATTAGAVREDASAGDGDDVADGKTWPATLAGADGGCSCDGVTTAATDDAGGIGIGIGIGDTNGRCF